MGFVDLWACVAAAIAGGCIAIRSKMLRPHRETWAVAPWPVWVSLSALAIALGMTAVAIGSGAHATAREAMVYSVLAVCSAVMLWNLNRQRDWNIVQFLRGGVGLIQSIERRLDPEAAAIFRRATEQARDGNRGQSGAS